MTHNVFQKYEAQFEALWDMSPGPGHPLRDRCRKCGGERRVHRVDGGGHDFEPETSGPPPGPGAINHAPPW